MGGVPLESDDHLLSDIFSSDDTVGYKNLHPIRSDPTFSSSDEYTAIWSQGVQKALPDSSEVFLKNSQNNFLFFSKSRGILNNVLAAKNGLLGGPKIPKIAPESKNAIFSKSEIMIPQSNLGKRKVKLMLVWP